MAIAGPLLGVWTRVARVVRAELRVRVAARLVVRVLSTRLGVRASALLGGRMGRTALVRCATGRIRGEAGQHALRRLVVAGRRRRLPRRGGGPSTGCGVLCHGGAVPPAARG